jgi:pilus assembly protein CpaC
MCRQTSDGGRTARVRRVIGAILAAGCMFGFCAPVLAQSAKPFGDKPAKRKVATAKPAAIYHLDVQNERIDVHVTLHKSENVKVEFPFSEALVGNAEIADVVPLTNASINILGKKIGVTRLSLLDQKKQVLGIVDVEVTHDVETLKRVMRDNPSFANLRVTSANGRVMLTGVAPDSVAMSKVLALAEQFAPGEVTNAMTVASPQQVMLEVRFIEASRTLDRGFGVNVAAAGKRFGGLTGIENYATDPNTGATTYNLASGLGNNLIPFGAGIGAFTAGKTSVDVVIKALEEQGLARRLAEPNLVALSGDTASFLAGGEFPFPVAGANNTVMTEFKKFGIGLAFTPTVLAGRQINLKIEPEVSEIDISNQALVGNMPVPGLSVRRASTTVELRDGQSFMIAGLLQGSHVADTRSMPWIGEVPVLGALFRSQSFKKKETDLVIIVTPRLVRPQIPGDKQGSPLDNRKPANDVEFFLDGKQEVQVSKSPRNPGGHIIDYAPGPQVDADYMGAKQ